ncbi:hypothetical protein VH569_31790 [Azospirillum sp. 11R-A]
MSPKLCEVYLFRSVETFGVCTMRMVKVAALLFLMGVPVGAEAGDPMTIAKFEKMYLDQKKSGGKSNDKREKYLYYMNGFLESAFISNELMFKKTNKHLFCLPKYVDNFTDFIGDKTFSSIQERKPINKISSDSYVMAEIFLNLVISYPCQQ